MGAAHVLHSPRHHRLTIGAAVVVVLVALGCAVLAAALSARGSTAVIAPTAEPSRASATIFVHVLGAVRSPGLFELHDGDRAVDAITAAGGFSRRADETALNLARFVSDGEQIIVPVVGATPTAAPGLTATGAVNINSADAATLETLPRVGPAMAARIIEWRESNGRFAAIDDLKQVTGIGEKTFAELKPLVSL